MTPPERPPRLDAACVPTLPRDTDPQGGVHTRHGVASPLRVLPIVLMLLACGPPSSLAPFTSDGCSLFPDRSPVSDADWCGCCVVHDMAYWRGGTEAERLQADLALKTCVAEKTGSEALAVVMYEGVRAGGSPHFVNWYRWGYGWGFERKYQALTPAEVAQADELLRQFQASTAARETACGSGP